MDARLQQLIGCHSTPGDEDEVRLALESAWRDEGWVSRRYGQYAVSACAGPDAAGKPVLLVCAHMDSPGYVIDRMRVEPCADDGRVCFGAVELGGPAFGGRAVAGVLKTRRGRFRGTMKNLTGEGCEPELRFELAASEAEHADVRQGDRICFAPQAGVEGDTLTSPFLDNRLGCWLLTRLAAEARAWQTRYRVVLGATACEEMCGFGANVLAEQVRPELVVVLDTTYESEEQGVLLGRGPVLTLSDASVLLGPAARDRVLDLMGRAGVPLQTEVYNFSGTDARAFPRGGLTCPVLPVLIPTRGNHSPCEAADCRDLAVWAAAVRAIAEQF